MSLASRLLRPLSDSERVKPSPAAKLSLDDIFIRCPHTPRNPRDGPRYSAGGVRLPPSGGAPLTLSVVRSNPNPQMETTGHMDRLP
jgi:hypothetical protein